MRIHLFRENAGWRWVADNPSGFPFCTSNGVFGTREEAEQNVDLFMQSVRADVDVTVASNVPGGVEILASYQAEGDHDHA